MPKSDFTTFEEYKYSVYECVKMVESIESDSDPFDGVQLSGCFNFLLMNFVSNLHKIGLKSVRKDLRNKKVLLNADSALSNKIIKRAICANLKGTEKLPIDIANVVTQSFYHLPKEVTKAFDLSAMVVAYMCYRLSKIGVENYCKN